MHNSKHVGSVLLGWFRTRVSGPSVPVWDVETRSNKGRRQSAEAAVGKRGWKNNRGAKVGP